jgi:hypothetical protein
MIVTPEESHYDFGSKREECLDFLVQMAMSRMNGEFTRSTVVPGEPVAWKSDAVPSSLRTVVDHLIARGAYQPISGKTAGHFAIKVKEGEFLTSRRKVDFNKLEEYGLVRVRTDGDDKVIVEGFKPSVGGQSQRIIFEDHKEMDCIAHAHIEQRPGSKVPVIPQWENECGSTQCGDRTSKGLRSFMDGQILAVHLENHGPNVVFNKSLDPQRVIEFLEANWIVENKTGGKVVDV